MKPSDFILNSDYLSLSTYTTTTKQITFAGGTLTGLNNTKQTIDITVPKVEQAEFQYMISPDGNNWFPTNQFDMSANPPIIATLIISRIGPDTLQASLLTANTSTSTATYPAKTFWVKESAIIAPDME